MKIPIAILTAVLFLMSCSSEPRGLVIIERYDKNVSLVRDKHDKVYFQSLATEQCGFEHWYTNLATFSDKKGEAKYEPEQRLLEEIIDLTSFKLYENHNNIYYFQDKNNGYTVYLTICDNVVSYTKKNAL